MHTSHIIFPLIPFRSSLLYSLTRTNKDFLHWYNSINNYNNNNKYEYKNNISLHKLEFYYKYQFTSKYYKDDNMNYTRDCNNNKNPYMLYDTLDGTLFLKHDKTHYYENVIHNIHYCTSNYKNHNISSSPGINYTINTQYSLFKNNVPTQLHNLDSTLIDIIWNYGK